VPVHQAVENPRPRWLANRSCDSRYGNVGIVFYIHTLILNELFMSNNLHTPNMYPSEPATPQINRREALGGIAAVCGALAFGGHAPATPASKRATMTIACIIRYEIDPFQRDGFKKHAENLATFVPRCGGHFVGFFLPYEGTNDVGWAMVAFDSLASYEAYKTRLKADPEARADAAWMQSKRIILHEERNFVELVDGTFNLPSTLAGKGE
jgi:hypothetical protein